MKQLIITALTLIVLVSCSEPNRIKSDDGDSYKVIVIDGCEYIKIKDYILYAGFMAHKGNCKNPIHKK